MYEHTLKEKVQVIRQVHEAQPSTISNKWLTYIDNKEDVIKLLKGNQHLVEILLSILTKEYDSELRSPRAEYSNPNWALLQADKSGYKRAIENFINLLTIKD